MEFDEDNPPPTASTDLTGLTFGSRAYNQVLENRRAQQDLQQQIAASQAGHGANPTLSNNFPSGGYSSPSYLPTISVLIRLGTAIVLLSIAAKFFNFKFPMDSIQGLPVWEWGLGVGIVTAVVGLFPKLVATTLILIGISFVGFAACTRDHDFDLAAVPVGNWIVAIVLLLAAGGLRQWAK